MTLPEGRQGSDMEGFLFPGQGFGLYSKNCRERVKVLRRGTTPGFFPVDFSPV